MKFEDVENARIAYNKKRKKVHRKAFIIVFGIFAVLAVLIALNTSSEMHNAFVAGFRFSPIVILPMLLPFLVPFIFALVITLAVASAKTKDDAKAYLYAYKAYFINQQLAKFFTDLSYNHEAGLDRNILASTGMIYTGDRYRSNDLTQGKYKNVNFTQADVTVQREDKDSERHTTYVTVFKGRYMIFEFPKKFNFQMIVTPHKFYGKAKSREGRDFKKIELESTEFNKRFNVYAEDGFEAFYILDPAFISSIEELGQKYDDRIALYFTENKLFIGINNGNDSFEPPKPDLPLDEKAETEKVCKDIKVITDFVDGLRLDH